MHSGCDSGLEQTDAARLTFDSHEAALDFAKHGVEDANRWLAAHSLNLADHYERLKLEIVVRCVPTSDAPEYHLVFRGVPNECSAGAADRRLHKMDFRESGGNDHGDKDFVFVGITQLVQSPEKIIPSLVWLKRHHHVKDFFRNVLGASFYSTQHFGEIIPEREMGVMAALSGGNGGSVSGTVKRGAQVGKDFEGDAADGGWQGFSQLDLMKILSSVRIWFNQNGVWITTDEGSNLPFQLVDASLGVLDA